ncbi:POTRA domain-containing protein [Bythopirellula polymerisocia]|nr:POTRA domain-containing protein [Bythopirellula polymerisocia]
MAVCFWGPIGASQAQDTNPSAAVVALNPAELVKEIRFTGNDTISAEQVASHLTTRVGRPFDRSVVQRDVRRLANLGWFIDVKPLYETTPQGRVVIFQVVERPTIRYITYLGNEEVSDKKLAKETGLKSGGAVDPYAVEEARRKLEEYYQGRGFNHAQVTILEGTKPTDKGISFLINEGNTEKIWNVEFVGNEFVSSGRLKSIIKTKPPMLKLLKGYVNRDQIDSDVDLLTAYYRSFGFFQAKISRKVDYYDEKKWAQVTFVISEGPRYEVRSVKFLGNSKFEPVALAEAAKLKGGEPFEQAKMSADAQWIQELYGSHGYVFADVRPEPVFLEEPGEVDLLYHIGEGEQFRVGRIIVHIGGDNPHTRIQTAINRMSVRPGDIVDIREIKASERRLIASGLYHSDPASGLRPKITYRIPEDVSMGLADDFPGDGPRARVSSNPQGSGLRGQSPDNFGPRVLPPPGYQIARPLPSPLADSQPLDIHVECHDWQHYQEWLEEEGLVPRQVEFPANENTVEEPLTIRGQSPESTAPQSAWWVRPTVAQHTPPLSGNPYQSVRGQSPANQTQSAYATLPNSANSPYGGKLVGATGPATKPPTRTNTVQQVQFSESLPPPSQSSGAVLGFPANPVPGYQVLPNGDFGFAGQPYPEQTVDIIFDGQETQTGRLQIGAGINSNAGIVGNIVIDERNFDWKRLPRSWEDIRNGTAFRGAGQRFRIDASPGSSVNRYLVSFQEPYLFDSPISLGLSGSYFDRRYDDWDEGRLGGRVSLGYQWLDKDLSTLLTYRGENVNISNIATAPGAFPDLDEVVGNNNLQGFKVGVINDTRDSSFLPTQGHYLELGAEQVLGSFVYPRIEAEFRTYWLMSERPDHSGRHVVSYSTAVGWMGQDAPIYDRFYAGGYATLRGFRFRGANPVTNVSGQNIESGGDFQWLNSLQYLFPITADDMLNGVVFCDFGTVEQDVNLDNFRAAPGFGLRVTVPAMGPAPIALDFAFPVASASFDREQVFSFSLGFGR